MTILNNILVAVPSSMLLSVSSLAGVTSFSATGSFGYSGQLTNQLWDTSDFSTSLDVSWNGVGNFDQSDSDSASLDGGTLNATTRVALSTSEFGGVTTLSYLESYVTTTAGPIERVDFYRSQSAFLTFTTSGWTRLQFTNLSGSLLGYNTLHFTGAEEAFTIDLTGGNPIVDWSVSIPSGNSGVLDTWDGVSAALLLSAGTWSLELADSFLAGAEFNDHLGFDMEFSSFPVPGPAGITGVAAALLLSGRRRR